MLPTPRLWLRSRQLQHRQQPNEVYRRENRYTPGASPRSESGTARLSFFSGESRAFTFWAHSLLQEHVSCHLFSVPMPIFLDTFYVLIYLLPMPRKSIKGQYLTTRVDAATKARIKRIALAENRTLSQVVALLVESALQARRSKEQVVMPEGVVFQYASPRDSR